MVRNRFYVENKGRGVEIAFAKETKIFNCFVDFARQDGDELHIFFDEKAQGYVKKDHDGYWIQSSDWNLKVKLSESDKKKMVDKLRNHPEVEMEEY